MTDLPANVSFEPNDDGWTLDQATETIRSVQAFLFGTTLNVELWGEVDLVSPGGGKRYDAMEFQQNSEIDLRTFAWKAKRIIYNVTADGHIAATKDGAVEFERSGTDDEVATARRI